MNDNVRRLRTARDTLHKLEDRGIVENNLTMEQITAIRIAEFAIDEICSTDVQPVDRWISVNNKLPEQDEKVLVLTKDKDIMTMIYKVIPFRWYKPKFGGFDKDYVTHWKPLPELPNSDIRTYEEEK